MDDPRRESLRLSIPPDSVLCLAVWLCSETRPLRINIAELGRPVLLRVKRQVRGVEIANISATGLRLELGEAAKARMEGKSPKGLFIYFKVPDLDPSEPKDILSLFLQAQVVCDSEENGVRCLAAKFVQRGLASTTDKALDFVNCEKYGISELTKWIEEIGRPVPEDIELREDPGLNLDNLLEELALALHQGPLSGQYGKQA